MSENFDGGARIPRDLLSSPRPPNPSLERGRLLMARRRLKMAEVELRRALRDDPENGAAHAYLALCLMEDPARLDEALETALWGTTKDLLLPATWYAAACVYERQGNFVRAEETLRVALAGNPELPGLYAAMARMLLAQGRARDALETAGHGLYVVPGDVGCLRMRGIALSRLGRHDEVRDALTLALENDPEDESTHLAFGWALLRTGEAAEAVRHFREALRLDPGLRPAKTGLMEALKARNPVYRAILRNSFHLPAMPPELKWGAIGIGVFIICMLGIGFDELDLPWAAALPFQALIAGAIVLTWTADPLFDLLLITDPLGRHSLTPWQRAGAVAVAAVLAVAAALGVAAVAVDAGRFGFPAVLAVFYTIPITAVLRAEPGKARWGTLAYAAAALALFAYALVLHAGDSESFGLFFGLCTGATVFADMVSEQLSRRFRS